MTWITDNVQRAETPKAGRSELVLVFCKLYHGELVIYSGHKYILKFKGP